jgi:integrase
MKLAVRRRLISANPFDHLVDDDRPKDGEPHEPHEWKATDLEALFTASAALAAKKESQYDYTTLLKITATLGLRIGEVTGLTWGDFDAKESVLYVRRQWTKYGEYAEPKTRAGVRRLALPSDIRALLIEPKLQSGAEAPIFASKAGTPLQHRNVTRRGFEPARDLAGLPETLTFHDLRHASVSRLIAAGLDPLSVAKFHGHGDPNVTMRVYAGFWNRQKADDAVRAALESAAS